MQRSILKQFKTWQTGLAIWLLLSATGCIDPKDRRPGLFLRGEVVADAVDDWSFSDPFSEVYLETATWYVVPHSVTTVCAGIGNKLYVPSLYYAGGQWPNKYWNNNVVSNPNVRIEIGGKLYERKAVAVEDPEEFQAAMQALAAKYPFWSEMLEKPESERPDMAMVRLDPR
jgi:hypothetical protein